MSVSPPPDSRTPTRRLGPTPLSLPTAPPPLSHPDGYEVLGELARGGMGVIYKARQLALDRVVALKVVRLDDAGSMRSLERFRREAEAVAGLDHPNIVPIYEVGEWLQGGVALPFFSMKLIEGGNLADHQERFRNDPRAAARLIADAARAVHHAHQRGILHRDLKPGNILLSTEHSVLSTPLITDFGIAKGLNGGADLTRPGHVVGTPRYMAPEQARGETLTTAADVWSLGVILYELLTGRTPVPGDTSLIALAEALQREPPSPRSLNPNLDRDLETICLRCLRQEPSERYSSAAALADDLDRWRDGQPILARRCGPFERLIKWTRRHPLLAGLMGLVVLVGLVGLGGVVWQWRLAEDAREAAETERRKTQTALDQSEVRHYFHRIALAHRDWLSNHAGRAGQLLDECPGGLRDWEWRYLKRLCHREAFEFRPGDEVRCVAYRPDGRRLAIGCCDGTVSIIDAEQRRKVAGFAIPFSAVMAIAWHPDGRLATIDNGQTLHFWDADTGRPLPRPAGLPAELFALAFHPDGRRLALTQLGGALELRNLDQGRTVRTLGEAGRGWEAPAFSGDGRRLAAKDSSGKVFVWETDTGKELLAAHAGQYLPAVALSGDGGLLAAPTIDNRIRLWDVNAGKEVAALAGHLDGIHRVVFTPNGGVLASAGIDQTVRVWDTFERRELRCLRGHTDRVFDLAFAPDGRRLASAGRDGALKVWDLADGPQELVELGGHNSTLGAVALSPKGDRLASIAHDQKAILWDVAARRELIWMPTGPGAVFSPRVAFAPDGKTFAFPDGKRAIHVRRSADGSEERSLIGLGDPVACLAYDATGDRLAAGTQPFGRPAELRVWDVRTGTEVMKLIGQQHGYGAAAFSGDGRLLATAGIDGRVRVHDAATGAELCAWEAGPKAVNTLAFRPGTEHVAGSLHVAELPVWDARTGRPVLSLRGHSGMVQGVAYSPDGRRMATAGSDHTVRVWDAESGQELLTLAGNSKSVVGVAFSGDGRLLASAGGDGVVRVWDGSP